MLKSCSYCGRIHERKYKCPHKPKPQTKVTKYDRFRWTMKWKNKRQEIRQRDLNLCQLCIRGMNNSGRYRYNSDVEVHHIIPLAEDFDKRLDNNNLICLCKYHHELAEKGDVKRETLLGFVK